jgi:hypothetical protein
VTRLKELVTFEGMRDNQLLGYGLVRDWRNGRPAADGFFRSESDQHPGVHGVTVS